MIKGIRKSLSKAVSAVLAKLTLLFLLQVLTVAAFIAACVVGLGMVRDYVTHHPEYRVNVDNINVANPPAWAPDNLGREIRSVMPAEASIFDSSLPRRVFDSCEALYWVDNVSYVRKVYPNTLDISLQLRKPVAYVMHGSEPYLADHNGQRLPRDYYRLRQGVPDLLRIKGVKGRVPGPGEKWNDLNALLAALSTVTDISGNEAVRKCRITTVDVQNYNGRINSSESHVVLWTAAQTRILWGRSSRDRGFSDLSREEKLANLTNAVEEYENLDRMEYVNIYSNKGQAPGKYRRFRRR